MSLSHRLALVRPFILAASLLLSLLAHPSASAAQGRCSCNNGCHQYPGQCVQRGGTGCDPGFAPFCGTRGATCPNASWVSCSGECTCVRVPGGGDGGVLDASTGDLGGADVSAPPTDARLVDVSTGLDRPAATDVPPRVDAPLMSPDVPSSDVASSDGPRPADASVLPDGAALDGPLATDAPAPGSDAGCECPGGVCIAGVCVTERCTYHPELGFICASSGTSCQLIDSEPYCVPLCLGQTCAEGEFCDESSGGRCVRDECATRTCPAGTTCYRNQCGAYDGGVTGSADAGAPDAGMTAEESGCGCRAAGPTRSMSNGWWGVAALVFAIRRRRR